MGLIIKGTIPKGTSIFSHESERFHHLVYPAKQFPPCWSSRSCYIHIWQRGSCFGFPFFQRSCFGKQSQFTVTHFFWICNFSCFLVINLIFFHFLAVESEVRKKNSWPGGQNFEKKSQNGWNVQLLNDPTRFFFWIFESVQKNSLAPPKKQLHPCWNKNTPHELLKSCLFRKRRADDLTLRLVLGGLSLSWMDIILGEKI